MRKLRACDLFCGAGGTSAGAESTGEVRVDFAVNHWSVAVETHSANFPHTRHVNSRLDQVNPGECGKIDLLFASPECVHHSRARGGRPTSDQQRSGAWDIMRWVEHHRPGWLVIENVREFEQWGPVHNGRPMKRRQGAFFEAWVQAIRAAGYQVDWRVLNAADFGAATSRERLFIMARKGRRNPRFPEPSHCQSPGGEFPGLALPRWRSAAEIIDWTIPCPSIFGRKRPLADKTLLRIEAGLRRFVGPFRYQLIGRGAGRSRGIGAPMPTMIATRESHGVCVPFQIVLRNNQHSAPIEIPLGTVCTSGAHHGLAMPFIVPNFGERGGQEPRTHGISDPAPTVTGHGAGNLATPFFLPRSGLYDAHSTERPRARSLERPLPTLIAADAPGGLVMPFLADVNHGIDGHSNGRTHDLRYPFLSSYYGNGGCQRDDCPLATITTKDRLSLVACELCGFPEPPRVENPTPAMQKLVATMRELGVYDIGFRMLSNPELSAAQGFDASYIFKGNKGEVTRQIGNSVSPPNARALTEAVIAA